MSGQRDIRKDSAVRRFAFSLIPSVSGACAFGLICFYAQIPRQHAQAADPSTVSRAQSDGLSLHQPRYTPQCKQWCDCFKGLPGYGKGFPNWTRYHAYRLPVVPPLYDSEFGYRAPNWRQLPAGPSIRQVAYPTKTEWGPPAQTSVPAAAPETPKVLPDNLVIPPAPPTEIELPQDTLPPPPDADSTPQN